MVQQKLENNSSDAWVSSQMYVTDGFKCDGHTFEHILI